ncbi:Bax inhibitor-1/YccA family protein, partial [Klebsiella pneumoniae]|nr:Bax inhibitor-1/YccA family protein [Klebsiella pneumoniae]
ITIDDVVTKTGITLGVLVVTSIISFVISLQSQMASAALTFIGIVASFILVLISTLGRKMQSAPVTILYAIFEGMWLGAFSQIV